MSKLLITGGTGLVGNALRDIYPEGIYIGSGDYDLTKEDGVKAMFEKHRPDKVIHLAAKVGGIQDNIEHPAEFFYQNILMNSFVIHYAYRYNVKKLIGVVSNCSYPDFSNRYPMAEEQLHNGPPALTNFSYGYAKRMLEVQVRAYRQQYNCNYFCVIPCSLYGHNDKFGEDNAHFIPALIQKTHNAKIRGEKSVKLFGTGRALRQYLYSGDLAEILLILMEKYDGEGSINIGSAENLSIKEIAEIILEIAGAKDLELKFDNTAPDGQLRKDISSRRLFEIIGSFEMTPLREGIRKTYEWFLANKNFISDISDV